MSGSRPTRPLEFLRSLAELEGYMFWVEGTTHFERPELSDSSDAGVSFARPQGLPAGGEFPQAVDLPRSGRLGRLVKAEITARQRPATSSGRSPEARQARSWPGFSSTKPELSWFRIH